MCWLIPNGRRFQRNNRPGNDYREKWQTAFPSDNPIPNVSAIVFLRISTVATLLYVFYHSRLSRGVLEVEKHEWFDAQTVLVKKVI